MRQPSGGSGRQRRRPARRRRPRKLAHAERAEDVAAVLELGDDELRQLEPLCALRVQVDLGLRVVVAEAVSFVEEGGEGVGAEVEVAVNEGDDGAVLGEEELGVVVKVELRRTKRFSEASLENGEARLTWRTSLLILKTIAFFMR